VGILAVVAGLAGAWGVRSMLVKDVVAAEEVETFEIPLAGADLPEGRILAMGDIGMLPMTVDEMKERGMPLSLVMRAPEQIIGRTLREPIRQGEPFLTTSVYLEGTGPDITKLIKPGYRAMNISLDRSAVMPAPGDSVDVVFRSTPRDGDESSLPIPEMTKTILQGISVLAVTIPRNESGGANTGGGLDLRRVNQPVTGPPPAVVTLAVKLEEANILQTVQGRGSLNIVVRSPSESGYPVETASYNLEDLLGIEPPPPPPQPIFYRTDIYRAGARSSTVYVGGVVQEETSDDAEPAAVPAADDASPLLPPTEDEDDAGDTQ
jgi:Flp pilus assembly protein CpaB